MTTPEEEDGREPGHRPGRAATYVLGAAAAGLGAVAAAELLDQQPGNGQAHPGTGSGHAPPAPAAPRPRHTPAPGHASPDLAVAPAAADPGYPAPQPGTGQAGTASESGSTGQWGRTGGSAAGHPPAASWATGGPGNGTATHGSAQPGQPWTALPARTQAASPATHLHPGLALPATSWPAAATTAQQAGAPAPPSAAATAVSNAGPWSVLYDAAGHPAGLSNAAGTFSAFPGTDAASASAASPLTLFDSAGQQAGTYSGASRLMPPTTAAQSPWLTGTPPSFAMLAAQAGRSAAPAAPAGPLQQATAPAQNPPQVPAPDAQTNQSMLNATPAQRKQMIWQSLQNMLTAQGVTPGQEQAIQQALQQPIPDLPDSFYAHGDYTYTDYTNTDPNSRTTSLNTLEAAATVAMLKASYSHFSVDIQELSDTAHNLHDKAGDIDGKNAQTLGSKFQAVDKMWDLLFYDVAHSTDPNIQAARDGYRAIRAQLFGGIASVPQAPTLGNIHKAAQAIRDKADTLYEYAACYVYTEQTNLSQFGLWQPRDDPRPLWQQHRFTVTMGPDGNLNPTDNSPEQDPSESSLKSGQYHSNNPGSLFFPGEWGK